MQPRIISSLLFLSCIIGSLFLVVKTFTFLRIFLYEKTQETTKELADNLIRNLNESLKTRQVPVSPTFCKPGKGGECVPPFINFPTKYRTAPIYDLSACVIEKSMSTALAGVMCFLYDPQAFQTANRSINSDTYHHRFCKNKNEFDSMRALLHKMPNTTLFTVVRDPIDRFISGFTDKCVKEGVKNKSRCYGCGRNASCFVEKQYERMMDYARFVEKRNRFNFEDVHFNPQTWYCNFRVKLTEFTIIHHGTGDDEPRMVSEMADVLESVGVNNGLLKLIKNQLLNSRTPHTTTDTTEREIVENEIRSNLFVMKTLVKMFYYDYVFLGFDLPVLPAQ